jgi:hypothetical protein
MVPAATAKDGEKKKTESGEKAENTKLRDRTAIRSS